MSGRERVLAALDGHEPDRIPLALGFYPVDGSALAPPGAWRADLVDVEFVAFPISAEEEELRRRAMPYAGNARLGSSSQVARYARWGYHPEAPEEANPWGWPRPCPARAPSVPGGGGLRGGDGRLGR